jgi:hypothetical protein
MADIAANIMIKALIIGIGGYLIVKNAIDDQKAKNESDEIERQYQRRKFEQYLLNRMNPKSYHYQG